MNIDPHVFLYVRLLAGHQPHHRQTRQGLAFLPQHELGVENDLAARQGEDLLDDLGEGVGSIYGLILCEYPNFLTLAVDYQSLTIKISPVLLWGAWAQDTTSL